jgi:thymidylate synthase
MKKNLNLTHITARDLPDAWFQLLQSIWLEGEVFTVDQGSFEGQQRMQLDFVTIHVNDPTCEPRVPVIPPNLVESIPAPFEPNYLDTYNYYILTPDKKPNEAYTYGQRLFGRLNDAETINPIEFVIEKLKKTPYTNQSTLYIAQPSDVTLEDPPCLNIISFRYIRERLHMFIKFRSNDAWGGFPVNMAGLANLFDVVTFGSGLEAGEFVYDCEGCHIYDHVFPHVEKLIGLERLKNAAK